MTGAPGNSRRFDSLDAFRFFAFLQIFMLHIPDFTNNAVFEKWRSGGGIGVSFFFVLSGCLISYLLAKEKAATGTINAGRFMLRRILRIWPLYFLAVLIAYVNLALSQRFVMGNSSGYTPNLLYSITFTENIKMLLEDNFPNGAPLRVLWSLCVEEQFYILWLLIFRFFSLKYIPGLLVLLVLLGCAYRFWIPGFLPNTNITGVDLISNIDYFCFGGFVGIALVTHRDWIAKTATVIPVYLTWLIVLLGIVFFFFHHFLFTARVREAFYFPVIAAALFATFIGVFVNRWSKFQVSNQSVLAKLGTISYGLYIYHTPIIVVLLVLYKHFNWQQSALQLSGFILLAFSITTVTSIMSYKFLEQPFLRLRNKYFASGPGSPYRSFVQD